MVLDQFGAREALGLVWALWIAFPMSFAMCDPPRCVGVFLLPPCAVLHHVCKVRLARQQARGVWGELSQRDASLKPSLQTLTLKVIWYQESTCTVALVPSLAHNLLVPCMQAQQDPCP